MSRNDEATDPATLFAAADRTWRQHQPGGNMWRPGTCYQCEPDGCAQLAWAVEIRSSRAAAYPMVERQSAADRMTPV
ncbi:hypothetical protein OG792_34080 [Micromonospora sp. NBC_01699]|uniref:hypothetical protein n=1 Tax=Micromonospora sp. NBC_01699 TaxID=2975984 RepID=UPI002E286098|nr:hypothetical protein [Micromonospora sp. NBC_01699]